MKKCDLSKKDIYILCIYFLTGCSILASFAQWTGFTNNFGNFNVGELVLVMFNDSYTGCFVFTFLFFFIITLFMPREQNIYFKIVRYKNKRAYFMQKQRLILKNLTIYISIIITFSIIIGFVNAKFSLTISSSLQKFSEMYFEGNFESNNLIVEIIKATVGKFLLLYFFALVYLLLSNFKISVSISLCINTCIMVAMTASFLGGFGSFWNSISLFSLAGSIYSFGISFFNRILILLAIDILLFIINFKVFLAKDITLPKGNKQYQNE